MLESIPVITSPLATSPIPAPPLATSQIPAPPPSPLATSPILSPPLATSPIPAPGATKSLRNFICHLKNELIVKGNKLKTPPLDDGPSNSKFSPDACVYCNALTIESKKEGLIQCVKCKCFAHVICAKAEEEDQNFVCFLYETMRV
uniref:Uncharacterized protein n=1 Tax=Cacopsylla melanoneura TaxID=428564 RepID=A0A8D9DVB4_9HEMI